VSEVEAEVEANIVPGTLRARSPPQSDICWMPK
jgi:hypothetical protein